MTSKDKAREEGWEGERGWGGQISSYLTVTMNKESKRSFSSSGAQHKVYGYLLKEKRKLGGLGLIA